LELVKSRLAAGDCVAKTNVSIQWETCRLGNIEATATSTVAVGVGVEMVKSVVATVVAYLVECRVVVVKSTIDVTRDQRINVVVVAAAAHVVGGSGVVLATAVPKVWNLPSWRPRYCKVLSYPVL
jgi:hypothetical protein